MDKRIAINKMHYQFWITPGIGIMKEYYGYYKYRIGFGWLNFRMSIGFIRQY